MLKFERKKIDLDLYGEKLVMRFPTVEDRQEYQRAIQGLDSTKAEDQLELESKLYSFLEKLGLPSDSARQMYDEDLVELVNHLLPSKKK